MWRNGRRARLRGVWETMWVQVPPPAPKRPSGLFFVVHTHFYTYFFANFRAIFFVKKHDILQRKRIFEKANIKHFKKCAKKFILQNNQVLLLNFLHILYNDERRNFV